jgi:hypothetical protein
MRIDIGRYQTAECPDAIVISLVQGGRRLTMSSPTLGPGVSCHTFSMNVVAAGFNAGLDMDWKRREEIQERIEALTALPVQELPKDVPVPVIVAEPCSPEDDPKDKVVFVKAP